MKVSFEEITSKGLHKIIKDSMAFTESETVFIVNPVADVILSLTSDGRATLNGNIKATADMSCGRCGQPIAFELYADFNYIFRIGYDSSLLQKEVECNDEDCNTVYLEEPLIDVDSVLHEQLTLSIPGKLLCRDNCKGLCHKCGALLDSEPCDCKDENPNSPFAILKNLKR